VAAEFPGLTGSTQDLQALLASCPSSLMYSWASPELVELLSESLAVQAPANSSNGRGRGSSPSGAGSGSDSNDCAGAAAQQVPGMLPALTGGSKLTARQELVLSNLVRVMAVISQHIAKQEEDRTTDFL
jgi:hypothetical protein